MRELVTAIALREDILALKEANLARMQDNHAIAQQGFLSGTVDAARLSQAGQFETSAAIHVAQTRAEIGQLIAKLEALIGMSLAEALAAQHKAAP